MGLSVVAIAVGASLGALFRWQLGTWLNALWPAVPPGTLAANLIGGYLIGVALAFFAQHPELPPEWRLLVVTGFLGGLTTFSTFSAEIVNNIMRGDVLMALAGTATHVVGSLALTVLGIVSMSWLRSVTAGG
jgi:CrcB protein